MQRAKHDTLASAAAAWNGPGTLVPPRVGPRPLLEMALRVAIKNVNSIDSIGSMSYEIARPILLKVTSAEQLRRIEDSSPHIRGADAEIWERLIQQKFLSWRTKNYVPKDPTNWHRVYARYKREEEEILRNAEVKLKEQMEAIQTRRDTRVTKIASHINSLPRPPRTGRGPVRGTRGAADLPSELRFTTGSRTKMSTSQGVLKKVRREAREITMRKRLMTGPGTLPVRAGQIKMAPKAMVEDYRIARQPIYTPKAGTVVVRAPGSSAPNERGSDVERREREARLMQAKHKEAIRSGNVVDDDSEDDMYGDEEDDEDDVEEPASSSDGGSVEQYSQDEEEPPRVRRAPEETRPAKRLRDVPRVELPPAKKIRLSAPEPRSVASHSKAAPSGSLARTSTSKNTTTAPAKTTALPLVKRRPTGLLSNSHGAAPVKRVLGTGGGGSNQKPSSSPGAATSATRPAASTGPSLASLASLTAARSGGGGGGPSTAQRRPHHHHHHHHHHDADPLPSVEDAPSPPPIATSSRSSEDEIDAVARLAELSGVAPPGRAERDERRRNFVRPRMSSSPRPDLLPEMPPAAGGAARRRKPSPDAAHALVPNGGAHAAKKRKGPVDIFMRPKKRLG